MYTGSYFEGDAPSLPKGYDGCAFTACDSTPTAPLEAKCVPPKVSPVSTPMEEELAREEEKTESVGLFSSIFDRLPLKGLFMGGRAAGERIKLLERIGGEEILLLGVALILFFSPDGDRLLSLILVALIFIN